MIPYTELVKVARKVAIRDKRRVLNEIENDPKGNKKSWGKWDKYPNDYTMKINDPKYPTAVVCEYIPELDLHLGIIDLDVPKENKSEHIPIEKLKSKAVKIIEKTYSVQSPSGGYQIYLLSKNPPKLREPGKLNIDYQVNKSGNKGKYCITDYRWNAEGKKEYYRKLGESPKEILIVDSIDDIFNEFLEDLESSGYIKTPQNEHSNEIVSIFKNYTTGRSSLNNFSLAIAGYLRKQDYPEEETINIIKKIFKDSGELNIRIENVKQTYARSIKEIEGWQHLKDVLGREDQERLTKITQNGSSDLRHEIGRKLMQHKYPSPQEIADLINMECDFYINSDTRIYYERLEDGRFEEIDHHRIVDYTNNIFGANQINEEIQRKAMLQITKKVKKDYNVLEFLNGYLNTVTRDFTEDKKKLSILPKATIPIKWNPDSDGGYIKKVIEEILDAKNDPENLYRWYIGFGHFFMGNNTLKKLIMVFGPSKSGKSTLGEIIQYLLNVSQTPTHNIIENNRFGLIDIIDKDVNIDDDIDNGIMRGIGNLNSVVEGRNMTIEMKNKNEFAKLTNKSIPKLYASGNTLPPIIGVGFKTRLLLIKAPHKRPIEERDLTLDQKISEGDYNSELEWLVHHTINLYWSYLENGSVLFTQEEENKQNQEYEFQSYPEKKAIEFLFKDDWEGGNTLPENCALKYIKIWCNWAYDNNKISEEHKRPSTKKIKNAINQCSFNRIRKEDGYHYEDLKMDEGLKNLLDNYLIEKESSIKPIMGK